MLDALWTRATIELEELKKFGVPAKVLKWRFQPRVSEKMKMLSIATDAAEVEVEMMGTDIGRDSKSRLRGKDLKVDHVIYILHYYIEPGRLAQSANHKVYRYPP